MKNKMEEIDRLIKESLSAEEATFYDELEEQSVIEMIGGLFQTKHRWLMIIMNIVTILSMIAMIYCIVEFFNAEDSKDLIHWAAGGFVCIIMISMLKVFSWLQMDKNAILRELKRLELQVASLSGKV